MNWVTEFWWSEDHIVAMGCTAGVMLAAIMLSLLDMSDHGKRSRKRRVAAQRTLALIAAAPVVIVFTFMVIPVIVAGLCLWGLRTLFVEAFGD